MPGGSPKEGKMKPKTTKIELKNNCLLIASSCWGEGYEFSVLHTPTGVESDEFLSGTLYEAFLMGEKVASGEATFWGGLPYKK